MGRTAIASGVVVEFAGLPGSGKSTITEELHASDPRIRSTIVTPAPRKAMLTHPLVSMAGVIRARGLLKDDEGAAQAWSKIVRRKVSQDRLSASSDPLVLEEGVAHHLWRTLFVHPALTDLPWSSLLTSSQPLVVLEAPAETRAERIRGKDVQGPVNQRLAAGEPGDAEWHRCDELFERLLSSLPGERRVVPVSTEGGLDDALGRVRAALSELAGSPN